MRDVMETVHMQRPARSGTTCIVTLSRRLRAGVLGVIAALVLGFAAETASAQSTQTFPTPYIGANRLDWCREWGQNCGKPAADAFCRQVGFQRSANYAKAPDIGLTQPTRIIGTGQVCNQGFCDGFSQITCVRSASGVRRFDYPRLGANRLDWCREWGQNCGKPAADAFCRSRGFGHAVSLAQDPDIGLAQPTRIIASGQICNQAFCDGFLSITCAP